MVIDAAITPNRLRQNQNIREITTDELTRAKRRKVISLNGKRPPVLFIQNFKRIFRRI
jgi:hypothetical protein